MADTEMEIKGIESKSEVVEQLGKAFAELESHRESSSKSKTQWEEVKEHFHNLERTLKRKFDELVTKENTFEEKQSETRTLLVEREAAVAAKEKESLNRLQQLKDIAVSAIVDACKNHKVASPVLESTSSKVCSSANDDPNASLPASEENLPDNISGEVAEPVAVEVNPHPQLREFCEQMDAKGLLKFISGNKRNLVTLREELSVALKSATEPARLVLDSLEGFYPQDQSNSQRKEDTALQSVRRICIILMESVIPVLGLAEPSGDHHVSSEIKQQAKAIADGWKSKLAGMDTDACKGYSLEAHAFLQLLVTFSIVHEFGEDELCKLILAVSRRRQALELCRSLGLAHKVPGVIEALVSSGRKIDAVHFAHAFQLFETYPPVPLLKQYLEDLKNNAQKKNRKNMADGVEENASAQELGALRAVIKCIEDYMLQEEYPLEPIKKQVAQLERAKSEKKRKVETSKASKFQAKRPRANGRHTPRKPVIAFNSRQVLPTVFNERAPYAGATHLQRYPYTAPPPFEVSIHAPYGQQANVQRSYHYQNERAPPTAPYSAPTNYESYLGTGLQSSMNNYGNYTGSGVPGATSYGNHPPSGAQPSYQPYM